MAYVLLPENVTYNKETGRISYKKNQKKGIYNALATGRKGIFIECRDQELKTYLEKELFALNQRQLCVKRFVCQLLEEQEKQDEPKPEATQSDEKSQNNEEIYSDYYSKIKSSLGRGAWYKLSDQSRIWIASAMMAYDGMKKYDRMVDFSGVCVQIGKACEYELKKRFFSEYVDFQKEKYGEDYYLEKLPDECMVKSDYTRPTQRKLLEEDKITLGKLRYVIGFDDNGRIVDPAAWDEFRAYAENELLVHTSNVIKTLREQLVIINKIIDEYRNPSAHSHAVSIIDARECIEYVVTRHRKLAVLLDQYVK